MPKKNISPRCKSDCNTTWKEFPHRLCFWDERRDYSLGEHQTMNPARAAGRPMYQDAFAAPQNQQGTPWAKGRCYTTFHSMHHYQFQIKGCIVNKLPHAERISTWRKKKKNLLCDPLKVKGESRVFRCADLFKAWEVQPKTQRLVKNELRVNRESGHQTVSSKTVNRTLILSLF